MSHPTICCITNIPSQHPTHLNTPKPCSQGLVRVVRQPCIQLWPLAHACKAVMGRDDAVRNLRKGQNTNSVMCTCPLQHLACMCACMFF